MPGTVVGVASEKELLVLTFENGARVQIRGLQELLSLLDTHHVSGKQLHWMDNRLSLVISRENLHEEERVRNALTNRFSSAVRVTDTLGAVSTIGAGINASFENLCKGSDALSRASIIPHGIATSSFRITWLVDRQRLDEAVRTLHSSFL
jgi:aspartate kinase